MSPSDPLVLVLALVAALSLASVLIGLAALRLIRAQLAATRAEHAPRLQFTVALAEDPLAAGRTREVLRIINIGGRVDEFYADPYVFMEVTYGGNSQGVRTTRLPFLTFYDTAFLTGDGRDLLALFENYSIRQGNHARSRALVAEFERAAGAMSGFHSVRGELRRYVHATYRDLWGASHEDVWAVDPVQGGRRLAKAAAEAVLRDHRSMVKGGLAIDLPRATPEEFMSRWLTAIRS